MFFKFIDVNVPFNVYRFFLLYKIPTLAYLNTHLSHDKATTALNKFKNLRGNGRLASETPFFLGNTIIIQTVLALALLLCGLSKLFTWCCFINAKLPRGCRFHRPLLSLSTFPVWDGTLRFLRLSCMFITVYGLLQISHFDVASSLTH